MSFKADTYRVFIASPSGLDEEREAATDAVNIWNAQHAAAERVVLLPVRWETHAKPQAGVRPQAAINTQLVRDSDIVVGMFWTKLGTSTGVAESGTVEEIDQFVAAGKPTLLYFSSRPVDPNAIDLAQHKKLKSFKAATYKKALVGNFRTIDELRQTLLRDLIFQVRALKARSPVERGKSLDEAKKITALIRVHMREKITPAQFEAYRSLFGNGQRKLKPAQRQQNSFTGLFFDYVSIVGATMNADEPQHGWSCAIDFVGDNYESKNFEVVSVVVNKGFDSAKSAIQHGKRIVRGFGVECVETREEVL